MPIMVIIQEACSPILNSKKKDINFTLNNKFGKDVGDFTLITKRLIKPALSGFHNHFVC